MREKGIFDLRSETQRELERAATRKLEKRRRTRRREDRPQPESRKRNQRTLEKGPFPLGRVRRKEMEESKRRRKHFLSLPPLVCFPLPPPPLFYDPSVSLSPSPSTGVTLYPWHCVKMGRWGIGVVPQCELRIFAFWGGMIFAAVRLTYVRKAKRPCATMQTRQVGVCFCCGAGPIVRARPCFLL